MTKRQRGQVVELLRCAADNRSSLNAAADALEAQDDREAIPISDVASAIYAWRACASDKPAGAYWSVCLKAAQRVEEGEWP